MATFLYKNGIDVSVVNPLSIKRFAQMHLKRNKTDKADAKIITQYGINQSPKLWEPCDKNIEESKDISQALEQMLNITDPIATAFKHLDLVIQSLDKATGLPVMKIIGDVLHARLQRG